MQQETLDKFKLLKFIVEKNISINDRIQHELQLLEEAPERIVENFLKAYQYVIVEKNLPTDINECHSLIAYELGITKTHPGKNSFVYPIKNENVCDIDIDYANPDEVKDYLKDKYGEDHIVGIPTYGKYKVRSLLSDLCRVVKDSDGNAIVSFEEIKALTKKLPFKIDAQVVSDMAEDDLIIHDDEDNDDSDIFSNEDIQQFGKKYPEIFQHFTKLYALNRYRGQHAAGVVITPEPSRIMLPLYCGKKSLCAEYSEGQGVSELSSLGFVKIDVLGLKTLKILDTANHLVMNRYTFDKNTPSPCFCKKENKKCSTNYKLPMTIRQSTGKKLIDLNKLCLNVPLVYKNLSNNKNEGIFQLEPEGISNYASKFEPKEFNDIAIITAAYRPGLMDLRLDDLGNPLEKNDPEFKEGTPGHMMFIERRKGRKEIIYPSNKVKPILEKSFGLAVYQEVISQMIMAMTNCDFGEAEKVRKYLTKVKPEEVNTKPEVIETLKKYYENYKEKALANNCTKKELDAVWNMIIPFARYGFNLSHAIAYSLMTYQTAFMRAIFPLEYLTSLMIHNVGNNKKDKIIQYTRTAQNLEFKVSKPDINKSDINYILTETNEIIAGLTLVNGVGDKAATEIIKNRKEQGEFTSIEDFLERPIVWRNVNIGVLNSLAEAGIFDSIEPNRKLVQTKININKKKNKIEEFQTNNIGIDKNGKNIVELLIEDFTEKEKKKLEREAFGFDFEDPLQKNIFKYKSYLKELNDLAKQKNKVASIGTVEEIKTFMQKNGQQMARITVTTTEGTKEQWILFASIWVHHKGNIKLHEAYCVLGKKDDKSILADTVRPVEELLNIN